MPISEKQIQDSIIELFQINSLYVQRVNSGNVQNAFTGSWIKLADKGHSDLVACDHENRICFIEVKSATGKLSVEQISFLREQHKKGRRWAVCASYEDAAKFLEDDSFHGQDKFTSDILDESSRFAPVVMPKTKRMSMSMFHEYNRWEDKKII